MSWKDMSVARWEQTDTAVFLDDFFNGSDEKEILRVFFELYCETQENSFMTHPWLYLCDDFDFDSTDENNKLLSNAEVFEGIVQNLRTHQRNINATHQGKPVPTMEVKSMTFQGKIVMAPDSEDELLREKAIDLPMLTSFKEQYPEMLVLPPENIGSYVMTVAAMLTNLRATWEERCTSISLDLSEVEAFLKQTKGYYRLGLKSKNGAMTKWHKSIGYFGKASTKAQTSFADHCIKKKGSVSAIATIRELLPSPQIDAEKTVCDYFKYYAKTWINACENVIKTKTCGKCKKKDESLTEDDVTFDITYSRSSIAKVAKKLLLEKKLVDTCRFLKLLASADELDGLEKVPVVVCNKRCCRNVPPTVEQSTAFEGEIENFISEEV